MPCPVSILPASLATPHTSKWSHSSLEPATLGDYLLRRDPGKLLLVTPVSYGGKHSCSLALASSSNATTVPRGREGYMCAGKVFRFSEGK